MSPLMKLARISALRKWVGVAGAILCVLLLFFISDALTARLRRPSNHFPCLPGQSVAVTGPLSEEKSALEQLRYATDSKGVRLVFDDVLTGHRLGGRMWRGTIIVGTDAEPGRHEITVPAGEAANRLPPGTFSIDVFTDGRSLRRASPSYVRRYVGPSPWTAAAISGALVLLVFGAAFVLSQMASRLMEQEGRAEIWQVREVEKGYEIDFGLGLSNGVQRGDTLFVFDRKDRPVGSAVVQEVFQDRSLALAGRESPARPGFVISRSV